MDANKETSYAMNNGQSPDQSGASPNLHYPLLPPAPAGDAVERVEAALRRGDLSPHGAEVKELERRVASYCGRKGAVATSNGTAALHLALLALEIYEDDVVAVPDFTYIASANPVHYVRARPMLVDAEPQRWGMDPELLERELEARYKNGSPFPKAMIVTHNFGMPARIGELAEIAGRYGIGLIEDAAEALGSRVDGRACGGFGDFSVLSFNANKIVTGSGGGMLLSDDELALERVRHLMGHARERGGPFAHDYSHDQTGYNYQMGNLNAALALAGFERLDERIEAKRRIAREYASYLSVDALKDLELLYDPWRLPEGVEPNYWLNCISHKRVSYNDRGIMADLLAEEGIEIRGFWRPLHQLWPFKGSDMCWNLPEIPQSYYLWNRGLALPSGLALGREDISYIVGKLLEAFEEVKEEWWDSL